MRCIACNRPLLRPSATVGTQHGDLNMGPVCARRAGLINPTERAAAIIPRATRSPAGAQLDLLGFDITTTKPHPMQIRIHKVHPDAIEPVYSTRGAAAFDLFSTEGATVYADGFATFDTGLAFEIPEGHVMMVFSRSGHGFKNGVRLANAVGVIDPDYRGTIKVRLRNDGMTAVEFPPASRIAQAMIVPVPRITFVVAEELTTTERGAAGLGSTGD